MDYRRKIIANSPHLASASGAVATFSDGEDLPLNSLNVNIEPVQSGTGDPSPDNVRPISGWNGVKVTRCGKNLCPPLVDNELTSNGLTLTPNLDGSVRVHGTATNTSAVLLRMKTVSIALRAGTYTFGIGVYPTNNKVYAQCVYSGGTLYARLAPRTISFNDTVTITRIDIGVNAASGENIDITLYSQLEKSSTETPYEPYNGVTVTVDLGQTVYGGTLNPLTGVLTVDRYWWELSTEASQWNKSSTYSGGFYTGGANYVWHYQQVKPNTPFICSHAKTATTLSEYGANRNVCYMDNSINIRIMSDTATKQDWIDYLTAQKSAGTPVQICCYLRNPVTIQLTPQQIRSLYGNNTIFADTGNVALEYWAHP